MAKVIVANCRLTKFCYYACPKIILHRCDRLPLANITHTCIERQTVFKYHVFQFPAPYTNNGLILQLE